MNKAFVRLLLSMGLLLVSSLLLAASSIGYNVTQGYFRAARHHHQCIRSFPRYQRRALRRKLLKETLCLHASGITVGLTLSIFLVNAALVFKPSLLKKVLRKVCGISSNKQVQLSDPASAYVIDGRVFVAVDGFASTPEPPQVDNTKPRPVNLLFTSTKPMLGLAILYVILVISLIVYAADNRGKSRRWYRPNRVKYCLSRHALHDQHRLRRIMLHFLNVGVALLVLSPFAFCIIPGFAKAFRASAVVVWFLEGLGSIREYATRDADEEVGFLDDVQDNIELKAPVPVIIRDGKVITVNQVQVGTVTSSSPETAEASAVAHETSSG